MINCILSIDVFGYVFVWSWDSFQSILILAISLNIFFWLTSLPMPYFILDEHCLLSQWDKFEFYQLIRINETCLNSIRLGIWLSFSYGKRLYHNNPHHYQWRTKNSGSHAGNACIIFARYAHFVPIVRKLFNIIEQTAVVAYPWYNRTL